MAERYKMEDYEMMTQVLIGLVQQGDVVEIVPRVPNAQRKFRVSYVLDDGFLCGVSGTSDGYVIPFNWIKSIKNISRPGILK